MGIFDLETLEEDPPAWLTVADESQNLLLFTTLARAFSLPVSDLPEAPVRGRGQSLTTSLPLEPGEGLAFVLPGEGGTYLALLSQSGYVRPISRPYLRPGTALYVPPQTEPASRRTGEAPLKLVYTHGAV